MALSISEGSEAVGDRISEGFEAVGSEVADWLYGPP